MSGYSVVRTLRSVRCLLLDDSAGDRAKRDIDVAIVRVEELLEAARSALAAIEWSDTLDAKPGMERPIKAALSAAIANAEGR